MLGGGSPKKLSTAQYPELLCNHVSRYVTQMQKCETRHFMHWQTQHRPSADHGQRRCVRRLWQLNLMFLFFFSRVSNISRIVFSHSIEDLYIFSLVVMYTMSRIGLVLNLSMYLRSFH